MPKKNLLSRSSVILIMICLVVLLTIFFLSYLNIKNISTLDHSVSDLSKEDTSIVLLRNCNERLIAAENHYRVYINSNDTNSRIAFTENIDSALGYSKTLSSLDESFSKKIQDDVTAHMVVYDAIKKLKAMADSMGNDVDHSLTVVTINGPMKLEMMDKSFFKSFFSNSTDTLKQLSDRPKGFFKKLGSLFSNKQDALKNQYVKGSAEEKTYLDSIQHSTDSTMNNLSALVKNYYQKSVNKKLSVRQELNAKETGLAESNLAIMSDINTKIKDLIVKKQETSTTRKIASVAEANNARKAIDRITIFSLIAIAILIGLLVYNIYRTNKYEEAIIEAKTSAEKLALIKGRFLSNMSHEIRSPLTAIMGFTEQIANSDNNVQNEKFLNAIKVSSNHLLHTVNDILDFSKLDAGKLMLNKEPFNFKNALDEVALAYSLQAEKKGIALISKTDFAESLTINGDAYRFKQILFNLVGNAIKFTEKGTIDIIASSKKINDKNIVAAIAVKDSGVGIPTSQLNVIFQEFAQATNTNNNQYARAIKGTGLGLSISKMLAELQGGSVTVESELGKGSIFTVKIPYETASPSDVKINTSEEISSNYPSAKKSGKNILLVEDNELNIMLITLLLERMGYAFDVATDGEMALQLHKQNNYNLILTDINIPKLTGIQLCEQIRKANDAKSKVKIVALTASLINDDFDSYYAAGINNILTKPFKEQDFRNMVEEYVDEVSCEM